MIMILVVILIVLFYTYVYKFSATFFNVTEFTTLDICFHLNSKMALVGLSYYLGSRPDVTVLIWYDIFAVICHEFTLNKLTACC